MLVAVSSLAARQGRLLLILGLVAGIVLPQLAAAMRPWIGEFVAAMIFLAALRIGPRQAVGAAKEIRRSLSAILLMQLALPVSVAALFLGMGWSGPLAIALILAMAASPISGSPNLTMMTGHDPAPALRLMIAGTALLPLTVLPVLWLVPSLGNASAILAAAGQLLLIIAAAASVAFLMHHPLLRYLGKDTNIVIDGASALAMAFIVIGLMSAVGPAIRTDLPGLFLHLAVAFGVNFGLQVITFLMLVSRGEHRIAVPFAIVAGNRNMALFLTALPAAVMDPLLLFIGCYQIPMYVTPMLLGPLYARAHRHKP